MTNSTKSMISSACRFVSLLKIFSITNLSMITSIAAGIGTLLNRFTTLWQFMILDILAKLSCALYMYAAVPNAGFMRSAMVWIVWQAIVPVKSMDGCTLPYGSLASHRVWRLCQRLGTCPGTDLWWCFPGPSPLWGYQLLLVPGGVITVQSLNYSFIHKHSPGCFLVIIHIMTTHNIGRED